jgi:hypothetical protein
MAIGVFGLNRIYKKQSDNIRERNLSYWPESAVYGYYGGGWTGSVNVSLITRLEFSNETVTSPGKNLPQARYAAYSLSSALYGYFNAGLALPATYRGEVERLDFSNQTISLPGKNMPARARGASISSRNYGYMVAGVPNVSNTFRLDFFSETIQDISRSISYAADGCSGLEDNFNYGYVIGGNTTSYITRLDYSSETYTLRSSLLPVGVIYSGSSSSSGYGYIVSGYNGGLTPNYISTITRLEFSTETVNNISGQLSPARAVLASTKSISYGYFAGGDLPVVNTISRLDFSSETTSNPGKNLPAAHTCVGIAGVSGGASVLPS